MTTAALAPTYWKNDIDDLLARATDVMAAPQLRRGSLNAAEAAHVLAGIMSLVQRLSGCEAAQKACADLVRHDAAWSSSFGDLPVLYNGRVSQEILLIAVVCRGLCEMTKPEALRAALSYWATETDPSAWAKLFA